MESLMQYIITITSALFIASLCICWLFSWWKLDNSQQGAVELLNRCKGTIDKSVKRPSRNYLVNKQQYVLLIRRLLETKVTLEKFQLSISLDGNGKTIPVLQELLRTLLDAERVILSGCQITSSQWLRAAMEQGDMKETFSELLYDLKWHTDVLQSICGNSNVRIERKMCNGELSKEDEEALEAAKKEDEMAFKNSLILKAEKLKHDSIERELANQLLEKMKTIEDQGEEQLTMDSKGVNLVTSSSNLLFLNPQNLLNYHRGDPLGKGAGGVVRKINLLGGTYAIKIMDSDSDSKPSSFDKEMAAIQKLGHHPHIVRLLCYSKNDDECFLIMEKMDMDLSDFLKERKNSGNKLSHLEAVVLMLNIAEGIRYIHNMHMAHRDLKPGNILVNVDKLLRACSVKITDFGLTKTKEASKTYSNQTWNTGTTRYMAPEVFREKDTEEKATWNPMKVDAYSFGIMCSEILTLGGKAWEKAFQDLGIKEMKKKVKVSDSLESRPDFSKEEYPLRLGCLIQRCWNGNFHIRPKFDEICEELRVIKGLILQGDYQELSKTKTKRAQVNMAVATPAISFFVIHLFEAVVDGADRAIYCKKVCKTLQASLKCIEPLLNEACKHSNNGNAACTSWLNEFKSLLEDSKRVTDQCLQETKSKKLKWALQFWNSKKLRDTVKSIDQQIQEQIANTTLVSLGILWAMNDSTAKKPLDFEPQQVPSQIVGQEEHFNKLKASILESREKSKHSYFGLHGMGGAGKTVLAKRLHNDENIKAAYGEHSIVWITVGCDARVSQVYERMAILLNDDVYKKKYATQCLEDQRTHLLSVFAQKEVLLILDDVWKKKYDHHHIMYWLDIATAPKSSTLITTRDSSILTKVHANVEGVLGLSKDESWELFCSYAFDDGPSNVPEQLARDVCKLCGRLPLALTVIGCAMLEKANERGWTRAFESLKQSKSIPDSGVNGELFGRLQLSYNELKDEQTKICFLYFAAFPEDYEIPIDELINMWTAEGLFGTFDVTAAKEMAMDHLNVLIKSSLVGWLDDDHHYVQVHNILRDVAMHIIEEAKPVECAYECYFQVGKEFKSFPLVESLQHVKRMSFMQSTIYEWPKELHLPHLQVCLLSEAFIGQGPLGIPLHLFSSMHDLQYLSLQKCSGLEILPENIGELKCLTHLILSKCESLKELPVSIGELKCLTHLDLNECTSLKKLPVSIGELKCLTHLILSECESLKELSVSIGELKCLTYLDLYGCASLMELPLTIGELKCLTHLILSKCESLKELRVSIGELKSLTHLDLNKCTSLMELPMSIGELKCLTHLNLRRCKSLKELPVSIGELKCLTRLDLNKCTSLKMLPVSIGELKCLTHLILSECESLKELPVSIGELKGLTYLDLYGCASLMELPLPIGELKRLIHLNLRRCKSLKELPVSIGELNCLTYLDLYGCVSLKELPMSIGELKCLTHLILSECESLKELPVSIGELKCLTRLDLTECTSLKELPVSIGELKCLTNLNLEGRASSKDHGDATSLKKRVGSSIMSPLPLKGSKAIFVILILFAVSFLLMI